MSINALRLMLRGSLFLVVLAMLSATAGCANRPFQTGVYHLREEPDKLIEFMDDGTVTLSQIFGNFPIEAIRGKYEVSGNQIIFKGGADCAGKDGTYAWSFDGKTLKLNLVSDDCYDRKGVFDGADFIKE